MAQEEGPPRKRAATDHRVASVWLDEGQCSLEDFRRSTECTTDAAAYPLAQCVEQNVLIYDRSTLPLNDDNGRRAVSSEWATAMLEGPGVFVVKGGFSGEEELRAVDQATEVFNTIMKKEREAGDAKGDHFGKPGANTRIWNAVEKLAVEEPEAFVRYYANPIIALASRAWLGRDYQVSSQVNVVHPGGEAQQPHRDYHLGYPDADQFPAHVHRFAGPVLTLQGLVAHCDMPLESGPTLLLPHSQKYPLGYLAFNRPEFKEYAVKHFVQLPLAKGDQVYFNPALVHAAGTNRSRDIHRMGNLLQVSSAMGRAMEAIDRTRMSEAIYPALLAAADSPGWSEEATARVIAASAEGYAFPTNLDRDQPIYGLAPEAQAAIVARAVAKRAPLEELRRELQALSWRKLSH